MQKKLLTRKKMKMNHDCGKFDGDYLQICTSPEPEDEGKWIMDDIDSWKVYYIEYCPFCGKELSKPIDAIT